MPHADPGEPHKINLPEADMPREWYNIQADLPKPLSPPLDPRTGQPVDPAALARIFPEAIVAQEMTMERWVGIPEEVVERLLLFRPTPLRRARALEQALNTPARIYYKDESVSPAGSHKLNTAIAQAYYNKQAGITRIATETGAGQWGSSLALACQMFGIKLKVYMVRISFKQKPFRKLLMQTWGAECVASPSTDTACGRKVLEEMPDTPGSLGIAISEAVEDAVTTENTRYTLGSVLNHVLLHQTIIGLEAQKQMAIVNRYPDVVIGCCGGGSNFAGIAFPFLRDKIHGKNVRILGVEPAACPTLTRGEFAYDFGDLSGMTPLLPMFTLGHRFVPPAVHAGGLRYHGMAPLVSRVYADGLMEATSVQQLACYEAGILWARTEGFVPAPETTHAIAAVIQEAEKAREEGREKNILFCYSGHGLLDLAGYDAYLSGKLANYELPQAEIDKALEANAGFPKLP